MQLTQILELNSIIIPLAATDKIQVITQLVDLLHHRGKIKDYNTVLQAVMEREAIRSTGVGQGFAIPHAKTAAVDKIILAVGKLNEPIDFKSVDGKPVNLVILLLSPLEQIGPHVQAIACISRMMTDRVIREKLWNSRSADELYRHIVDYEKSIPT